LLYYVIKSSPKHLIMKLFLFTIICISTIQLVKAQSPGDDYAFTADYVIKKFDSYTGQTVEQDTLFKAQRGNIFTIKALKIGEDGKKGYSISFWKFNNTNTTQIQPTAYSAFVDRSSSTAEQIPEKTIDKDENGLTFYISDEDLKSYATNTFRKPKGAFKIDGVVLPIKLRFKNKQPAGEFDFEQSISVGPAVSWQVNYGGAFGTSSFSLLTGVNITNVSVDDKTVANNLITSKTTVLALSPFIGFNIDYQNITFSVITGYDVIPGKVGSNWAYRNSPWLGFGIGTSIFSTTSKKQNP